MSEPPSANGFTASDGDPLEGEGLALAYAALDRVRSEHRLERLTVAVDDSRLGRQLLVAPRADLPDQLGPGEGWHAEPPGCPATDIELAVTLCLLVLRVSGLDQGALSPLDTLELQLRALDGVDGVAIDEEHDVVRVQTVPEAPTDVVARDALGLVKARLDRTVVVELVAARDAAAPRPDPAPISWSPAPVLELIALREDRETGDLEVHLRGGEVRTIGRAPQADGLVGAAEATLEAWRERPGAPARSLAWAHTVATPPEEECVVAVALDELRRVAVAHGIGTGSNPIEAAVRATIDALSR